jgi:hypothetical protein
MADGVVLVLDCGERKKFAAFLLLFLSSFVQQNLTDMMSMEVGVPAKSGCERSLI